MLPELTGEEAHPAIQLLEAIGKPASDLTEEEKDAIAAHVDLLEKGGWLQREDGSWHKPAIVAGDGESGRPRKPKTGAVAKVPTVRSPRDKPRHPHLRIVD